MWGEEMTEKVVWHVVKEFAAKLEYRSLHHMTCAGPVPVCATQLEVSSNRFSSCWVTFRCKQLRNIWASSSACMEPSMTGSASSPDRSCPIANPLEG